MNSNQKKVLAAMAFVILSMFIFPPYVVYGRGSLAGQLMSSGYTFILDMENISLGSSWGQMEVNLPLLIVQWVGVIILGIIGMLFFKEKT
jgi:hypothetical protein